MFCGISVAFNVESETKISLKSRSWNYLDQVAGNWESMADTRSILDRPPVERPFSRQPLRENKNKESCCACPLAIHSNTNNFFTSVKDEFSLTSFQTKWRITRLPNLILTYVDLPEKQVQTLIFFQILFLRSFMAGQGVSQRKISNSDCRFRFLANFERKCPKIRKNR